MVKVFVYGTLKRGFHNHYVMEEAQGKLLGNALLCALLCGARMYSLGPYPAVKLTEEPLHQVEGELYEVPEAGLARLDALEGHPRFYRREQTTVLDDGGASHADVWVYLYPHPVQETQLIASGVWTHAARGGV